MVIQVGDSTAAVKQEISDLLEYVTGDGEVTSWLNATNRINEVADLLGRDGIADGMAGATARARINALWDGPVWAPGSDLAMDFREGLYYRGTPTDTHATDILALGSTGYETFAPNVLPRTDLGLLTTVGRTNSVPNSSGSGAVVGVVGSGGALPTGWTTTNIAGLVREVVSITPMGDFNIIKFRWSGTAGSNSVMRLSFVGAGIAAASTGQVFAGSASIRLVANSGLAGSSLFQLAGLTGVGSTAEASSITLAVGSELERIALTRTIAEVATESVGLRIDTAVASGETVDLIIDIAVPQLEEGPFATDPIITEGSAVTRPGNRPVVAVPDGARAFVLDMDLLEPPVQTDGVTYMADYSIGNGNERISLVRSTSGNFTLDLAYDGSYVGGAPGTLPLTQGRNILFGVAANGYLRKGMVGQSDPPERTDLSLPSGITALGFGSRWWTTNNATYMRSRRFAEFRNITDPEAAFAQAKALAQEWAAE